MKKILSLLSLAALAIGLLGSCSKINERIDSLEKKVNGIESEQIASIKSQVDAINTSIADLGTIRQNVQTLMNTTPSTENIEELRRADEALGRRIDELKSYTDGELKKYATTEWVKATFATLEQHQWTCDTIAKIDERIGALDAKLSQSISGLESSLKQWVNEQLDAYYTAAQMDAKLDVMQNDINNAKAQGKTATDKADSIATELTTLKTAVDTAKANIRDEYKAAIQSAIETSEGKLTKDLQDSIAKVNDKITALDTRVKTLEGKVLTLEGNVNKLLAMIQSVSITPAYSDGSVEAVNGILTLKCIVSPAEALIGMESLKDSLLLYADSVKVKTKATTPAYMTIKVSEASVLDAAQGAITLKADISEYLPKGEDKALTVAVNIKNGISDFTTKFVPVTVAAALPGEFSIGATKKVQFSRGNLYWDGDSYEFEANQYTIGTWNAENHVNYFFWSKEESVAKAESYSDASAAATDVFFTNAPAVTAKSDFTVNGVTGEFRTLSAEEWTYILSTRANAVNLLVEDVTVCGVEHCLVIAPDACLNSYVFDKTKKSYDAAAWATAEAAGLVCLPPAGYRDGTEVKSGEGNGFYWASTTNAADKASNLGFKKSDN